MQPCEACCSSRILSAIASGSSGNHTPGFVPPVKTVSTKAAMHVLHPTQHVDTCAVCDLIAKQWRASVVTSECRRYITAVHHRPAKTGWTSNTAFKTTKKHMWDVVFVLVPKLEL